MTELTVTSGPVRGVSFHAAECCIKSTSHMLDRNQPEHASHGLTGGVPRKKKTFRWILDLRSWVICQYLDSIEKSPLAVRSESNQGLDIHAAACRVRDAMLMVEMHKRPFQVARPYIYEVNKREIKNTETCPIETNMSSSNHMRSGGRLFLR